MSDCKSTAAIDTAMDVSAMAERDRYVTARDKLRGCESRLAKVEAQRDALIEILTAARGWIGLYPGEKEKSSARCQCKGCGSRRALIDAALAGAGVNP